MVLSVALLIFDDVVCIVLQLAVGIGFRVKNYNQGSMGFLSLCIISNESELVVHTVRGKVEGEGVELSLFIE